MKKNEHSLGFHLCLEKSELSDVYEQMLEELKSEEFFFKKENPGIRFDKRFDNSLAKSICQGLVAGTTGSLKWESKDSSRTVVDFIIGLIHCKKATKKLKFRSNKVVQQHCKITFCSRTSASTFKQGNQQQILSTSRLSRPLTISW